MISSDLSFLPNNFLFEFELYRLEYSEIFGYIRNVSPFESKMIITMFLVVKIFIKNVIIHPYIYSDLLEKNEELDLYFFILIVNY